MRLIHTTRIEFQEFFDAQLPKYAILSHCWAEDEVTYQHFQSGFGRDIGSNGWRKILRCCEIARAHKLDWAWVDTCCIDKSSTAELSEAINSMYRWYDEADVCYVFLLDYDSANEYPPEIHHGTESSEPGNSSPMERLQGDVVSQSIADDCNAMDAVDNNDQNEQQPQQDRPREPGNGGTENAANVQRANEPEEVPVQAIEVEPESSSSIDNIVAQPGSRVHVPDAAESGQNEDGSDGLLTKLEDCRWFTRGWTLQELLAPSILLFYDSGGYYFGSKSSLTQQLAKITGIDIKYLQGLEDITTASVSCRMSWASKRRTTRRENIAYCLLGLFDINMPLLYGEGAGAFQRLQEEIIGKSSDETIFAWTKDDNGPSSLLAESPECFWDGAFFVPYYMQTKAPPCRITSVGIVVYFIRNILEDVVMLGQSSYQLSHTSLPLACRDTRWEHIQCAEVIIRREEAAAAGSEEIMVYYRIETDKILRGADPFGALSTSKGFRSGLFSGSEYKSVYVQRTQLKPGHAPGLTRQGSPTGSTAWVLMGVVAWVGIALLTIPFASVDRDTVRLWASLQILLVWVSFKTPFLLAMLCATFLTIKEPRSALALGAVAMLGVMIGGAVSLKWVPRIYERLRARWIISGRDLNVLLDLFSSGL